MSWPRKLSALAWPIAAAAAVAADPTPSAGPTYPGWLSPVQHAPVPVPPGGIPAAPAPVNSGNPMPSLPGTPPAAVAPAPAGPVSSAQPGSASVSSPAAGPVSSSGGCNGEYGCASSSGVFGAEAGGCGGPLGYALPNVAGSFLGMPYQRAITATQVFNTQFAIFNGVGAVAGLSNQIPVAAQYVAFRQDFDPTRGGILIGENESPKPTTRAYFRYQYADGIPTGPSNQFGQPFALNFNDAAILQAATAELNRLNAIQAANGLPAIAATPEQAAQLLRQSAAQQAVAGAPAGLPLGSRQFNLHRETFGIEKAFCSDLFSVGLRVPLVQSDGDGAFRIDDVGNISLIFKALLYTNLATGNLISGGFVVSAPTGPVLQTVEGEFDTTFVQPFLGFIYHSKHCPRLFVQGFTGAVIPSDDRDVMFYFNDLAVNYTVYRACESCSTVQSVTPAIELHSYNPLSNVGLNAPPIGLPHILNATGALHLNLCNHWQITTALSVPVAGPKLFDYEAQFAVDYRF